LIVKFFEYIENRLKSKQNRQNQLALNKEKPASLDAGWLYLHIDFMQLTRLTDDYFAVAFN
jgi:hypothetical protein